VWVEAHTTSDLISSHYRALEKIGEGNTNCLFLFRTQAPCFPFACDKMMNECVMTMESTNAAYGVYAQDVQVTDVVHALNDAGFDNEDICLMLARTHPISAIVREASVRGADREDMAAPPGIIDWLSEFGAVVIRTFGFFIRSQTFLPALVPTRDAPALCGSAGTLVSLGFTEEAAGRVENQLRQAGAVVYVACSENARAKWARALLHQIGAEETAELELDRERRTAA